MKNFVANNEGEDTERHIDEEQPAPVQCIDQDAAK